MEWSGLQIPINSEVIADPHVYPIHMNIDFEVAEHIHRPVSEVFLVLSDFSNMVRWNYFIQRASKISPGAVGPGTLFEMKRPRDLYVYKVIEFDPPVKITVELQPPGPNVQLIFNLQADGQHTHLRYQWIVQLEQYGPLKYVPSGWFKQLIVSIPRRIILTKTQPAVRENVKRLKALLETGQTILQDGRRMTLPTIEMDSIK